MGGERNNLVSKVLDIAHKLLQKIITNTGRFSTYFTRYKIEECLVDSRFEGKNLETKKKMQKRNKDSTHSNFFP